MEVNEEINKILDKDEEIVYQYKPNKKRFVIFSSISTFFFAILFGAPFIVFGALGVSGIVKFTSEKMSTGDIVGASVIMVMGIIVFLLLSLRPIVLSVRYRKAMYIITNKRLIVRNGFIGADYNSLNLNAITMINVRVDFLDKLTKPNTGTITFASSATPLMDGNQTANTSNLNSFAFFHISNPYDTYQEIKSYINEKTAK